MKIELTKEEVESIIQMMNGASIQIVNAENALKLYKKFKDAKE